ncbi:DedA family protein [Thermincola potens]|uniref:SNARE associated Golgi protein-related protein n=1 Tax=Thermincola potens (strain JR) TaxID=635013 RepID=D5XB47_THEPJ|nr:DedA family protein [Thermincola potens]ADG81367.1 SNARE associated Golgi protein-related protein [Thermincola potens JR]
MSAETFLSFIETYGYYAVFLALMVGMLGILPVPEETSMVFIGFLVSRGNLSLGWSIVFAFLGTTSGMTAAYLIGRRLGTPIIKKYGKRIGITPERLAKTEKWFKKYGKWTLAIGYFVPGLRQITAYSAGITRLPYQGFALMAYIGAALWTTVFINLGAYLGEHWRALDPLLHRYTIWLFVAVLVFLIVYGWSRTEA